MKKISFITLLLVISQNVFANVACPSIETIKGMKFSSAAKISWITGENNASLWMANSDNFTSNGETWNLWYSTFSSAANKTDAMKDAMTNLDKKQLIKPSKTFDNNRNVCIYTSDSDAETVTAFNPPNPPIKLMNNFQPSQSQNSNQAPSKN